MSTKSAKEVVLGVTGSIAAYKACDVASQLVKQGIEVHPVLTASATQFIRPAALEALTGRRAITDQFGPEQIAEIDHITLAQRVDAFIIAPATANIIAKAAVGIADDWLTTALLATRAPILFAPAMNTQMYEHGATQENLAILRLRGCRIVEPQHGVLACKTVGVGKMAPVDIVVDAALALIRRSNDLAGKHVLITSGANHEPIDPVRFIGNRSSGKMGRALALEALRRGARVTVITGPAEVAPPAAAEVIAVQTAQEMLDAVMSRVKSADIVIGAAAVADYRVADAGSEKHKRNGRDITLKLVENPDIIAQVGAAKTNGQIVVGFAAETKDLIENAREKLTRKHLDLIVANAVNTTDSGFGTNTTKAWFLTPDGTTDEQPLMPKTALAEALFDRLTTMAR